MQDKDADRYQVASLEDLALIIEHFDNYPLLTQKQADYLLFKQVFNLVSSKEHLTKEGFNQLLAIKASSNKGFSDVLKKAFPNVIPIPRPLITSQIVKDPYWLTGFTSGEGCFLVSYSKCSKSKFGSRVQLIFSIYQHTRDAELMGSLAKCFSCGRWEPKKTRNEGQFVVSKFSDITDKIIPLFNKYPIAGVKSLDFADFCKVAELMKEGRHLTEEGLAEIKLIKVGMNKGRTNLH